MEESDLSAILDDLKEAIPKEVKRASEVLTESQKIMSSAKEEAAATVEKANLEAEHIITAAKEEADRLVRQEEIVRQAEMLSKDIKTSAQRYEDEVKQGADQYADQVKTDSLQYADDMLGYLGNSLQPNIEQIINLNPDALLPSPFENSGGLGRVERLGIPVIWCADYMESTPLARAEWIRFYGRLVGKAERADSIFDAVEKRYQDLCSMVRNTKSRPRLLPEMPWSGQWTLPGSGSSSAKLYADAGAEYLFAYLEGSGGIPLSTEKVVDKAVNADIWLIKHHGKLDRRQMVADTPLLANIKAPILWCDTSVSFIYEETPFHPERLLESLITILHPELEVDATYNYFKLLTVED